MTSLKVDKVHVVARWSHNALTDHAERSNACNLCKKDVVAAAKGAICVEACGSRFHSECWAAFVASRKADGQTDLACPQCHRAPNFVTLNVLTGE